MELYELPEEERNFCGIKNYILDRIDYLNGNGYEITSIDLGVNVIKILADYFEQNPFTKNLKPSSFEMFLGYPLKISRYNNFMHVSYIHREY